MIPRTSAITLLLAVFASLFATAPASAQGFGEQAAPSFRYSNQGLSNEVYRIQYGATALSSAASASGGRGGLGSGQTSDQLNNVVQITNNSNYSVSINGSTNSLSFDNTVNADQKSAGTAMKSTNSGTVTNSVQPKSSSDYLNK